MIRAIQTRYNGYLFRSRLEARWAVFFDSLGLRWEYEPEGYWVDEETPYLPDFFVRFAGDPLWASGLPAVRGYWIEVKGSQPSQAEIAKLAMLCEATRHKGYIMIGQPWPADLRAIKISADKITPLNPPQLPFEVHGALHYLEQAAYWGRYLHAIGEPTRKASLAARCVRFEHGESPR